MIKKILIIQTAFPGDVILATSVLESLHLALPETSIDLLLRGGNESLFIGHPYVNKIHIWNKNRKKLKGLLSLIPAIRAEKYDLLINLQRFFSSGLLTLLGGAKETRGFDKNPLSLFFTKRYRHIIGDGRHETERNHDLVKDLTGEIKALPKIYPTATHRSSVSALLQTPYICIAPGSVWFTKKYPESKWIDFIKDYHTRNSEHLVYLIGSNTEHDLCERIRNSCGSDYIRNVAGKYSFLESAALMKEAKMNYVNDSAPMHLASAVNGKTRAVFCSTIPAFGFGPLSDDSGIIETKEKLDCRPCGLHGLSNCPQSHFKCAMTINVNQFYD